MKIQFPTSPALWEQYSYICPISGCQWITYEWCGVAGWRFVSRA